MYVYFTNFNLTENVNNLNDAQYYLKEENMTNILKNDIKKENFKNKIENIEWDLKTEDSGTIKVITNDKLTDEESEFISEWISNQNADGIGEGFEQQPFANYIDNSWNGADPCDDNYEEGDYIMASFDWQKNEYKLELLD